MKFIFISQTAAALALIGCTGPNPGFGPYPSIGLPGVASFLGGDDVNPGQDVGLTVPCQPIGPDQIGIIVFNFDNVTNEFPGKIGPGPVSHDVVIWSEGEQIGSLAVAACEAKCIVVPCPSGVLQANLWSIQVADKLASRTGPSSPDGDDYRDAATEVSICPDNPCVNLVPGVGMPCGKAFLVYIGRSDSGTFGGRDGNWHIKYGADLSGRLRGGGGGAKHGCSTAWALAETYSRQLDGYGLQLP